MRLAWAVHGLAPEGEPRGYRYRAEIEVFRGVGELVPVRTFGGEFRVTEKGSLVAETLADALPVPARATLFLVDPRPDIYTARVRITDLVTGFRAETTAGFEIRER
ncbi:MAG: hypothetical protein HY704_08310 [Gemmatimonadetes bacterium]|nr:hypothetical protein [Gemmatimonadota bacterium]